METKSQKVELHKSRFPHLPQPNSQSNPFSDLSLTRGDYFVSSESECRGSPGKPDSKLLLYCLINCLLLPVMTVMQEYHTNTLRQAPANYRFLRGIKHLQQTFCFSLNYIYLTLYIF